MFKLIPKLIVMLAVALGLLYVVSGLSFTPKLHRTESCVEKGSNTKMQAGFDIRNLSHHLLDFYK